MSTPPDAKAKAAATYNAAADAFDDPANVFWERFGRRTIDRLRLRPGQRVLDVCCGSGASAIPAAESVGPEGRVLGVDLAESLLALARAKASARGLDNIEFRAGDMLDLDEPPFDAVVCVFGIFFVPDMTAQLAELWRMVKPGGELAISTWGVDFLGPVYAEWTAAVRRLRPDLIGEFSPWDRIASPDALQALFDEAGIANASVIAESGHQPLRAPEDFWTIARGTGCRWTIDRMGPDAAATVKCELIDFIADRSIDRVATNVIYAVARRP
jgi:SAM-dependent methyltransferase